MCTSSVANPRLILQAMPSMTAIRESFPYRILAGVPVSLPCVPEFLSSVASMPACVRASSASLLRIILANPRQEKTRLSDQRV